MKVTTANARCIVCGLPRSVSRISLCRTCRSSLDKVEFSMWDVIEWAAKRARLFERRRAKAEQEGRP